MNGNGNPGRAQGHLLPSALSPPATSSSTVTSTLTSSQRPPSSISAQSASHDRSRDDQLDGSAVRKSHSHSVSSKGSLGPTIRDARDRQRAVRTLPPWVQSADEDDTADPTSLLLPRTPTNARPASHNHMPTPKANAVPGRHFDHAREGTPVTITSPVREHASKWQRFTKASDYDFIKPPPSRGHIVDDEWIKENLPDLETPWDPIDKEEQENDHGFWLLSASKRRRRLARFHRTIMNHPMVPLVIRVVVITFSALALGLAGSIWHKSDHAGCRNGSSTWMALLVDVVAIVYTAYITYDEYTSKPLGLRSHNAKMRLIFLDLLFIVFDAANLSLAFQALTDPRWVCRDAGGDDTAACLVDHAICVRQKALTATLLIALVAWLCTFAISTLRSDIPLQFRQHSIANIFIDSLSG